MRLSTTAIILHRFKFSDTSLIIKAYTAEHGLRSYIAKGMKGNKSKIKSLLFQPFSILNLETYSTNKSTIITINNASFKYVLSSINSDISKATQALFLSEILLKYIKEEEGNPQMFQFIEESILSLSEIEEVEEKNTFHVNFLIQLLNNLGISPMKDSYCSDSVFCYQEGEFMPLENAVSPSSMAEAFMLHNALNFNIDAKLAYNDRKPLLKTLLNYLEVQLGKKGDIKSLDVLEKVSIA